MQCHQSISEFYPAVFAPEDLKRMGVAAADALKQLEDQELTVEKEAVARIVLRFYRCGLVEPEKLKAVSVMFASSKLFHFIA